MKESGKILIQCDFYGTVTIEDASFAILDAYIPGKWQPLFSEYQQGKMAVGQFNSRVFSMINDTKENLLKVVFDNVNMRPGFREFVEYCGKNEYEFVIVSNGLDFYIEEILRRNGLDDIEFFASETEFQDNGISVRHRGPDGNYLDDKVKTAFTDSFLYEGYRVVYIGDGRSDLSPASKCHYVFATGSLLEHCKNVNLKCTEFTDFYEIINDMGTLL